MFGRHDIEFYILPDTLDHNRISGPFLLEIPCTLLTLLVGVEEASISGFHSKTVAQSTNIDTNLKSLNEDHTAICPRSLDPIYVVSNYMKWVKTSRTYSNKKTMVLITKIL